MTTRFRRRAGLGLTAMLLTLTCSVVNSASAQAVNPPAWDVCGQVDNGRTLCAFNYNPPESWPNGWAPARRGDGCKNAGTGFMPDNNVTSYLVNYSTIPFYVYDGLNCTGAVLVVYARQYGGMPSGWNDRLSSVKTPSIETRVPADAVTLENAGFID
jgi:hypothetical protein